MRKTKIIATLGPASDSEEVIGRLITAGVDAFRFNFSHGTHQEHLIAYKRARALSDKLGRTVALIQDLQGPKIRVGALENDSVSISKDDEVVLTSQRITGDATRIPVAYEYLEQDLQPGDLVLMDDGKLRLKVLSTSADGVNCVVIEGGELTPHKGVNFPGTSLSMPSLTPKDLEDLQFGMQTGFDAVALSFVSEAGDVTSLREEMSKLGSVKPIISKLERAACLDHLPEILDVSDAAMVARGDLGVEVDIKRVPVLQKRIISEANSRGIPVITATQMLESMTKGLMPTRAEAADIANAVWDGTDALMLSGETSVGLHPVEAVKMMGDIAVEAEVAEESEGQELWLKRSLRGDDIGEAICHTAVVAAQDLGLRTIVAITQSGQTALDTAKFRPNAAIHAFAFDVGLNNFLALSRGVAPHVSEYTDDIEGLINIIDTYLTEKEIAQKNEAVAIIMGVPIEDHKSTNLLLIHRVGEKYQTECVVRTPS
ncbi:MAG: pyruvate kinase [Desulfomonile tiedjei]|nr:pyruvate kinase [Desulfomonile tiedjei]